MEKVSIVFALITIAFTIWFVIETIKTLTFYSRMQNKAKSQRDKDMVELNEKISKSFSVLKEDLKDHAIQRLNTRVMALEKYLDIKWEKEQTVEAHYEKNKK